MANYDVDIEIALRGSQKITELTKGIKALSKEVNAINKESKRLSEGLDKAFRVDSVQNYSRALNQAERALRNVASGTDAERRAVERVVHIRREANDALARQNMLLAQAAANQRDVIATANAGFGMQGPSLPKNFFTVQGPKLPPGFTEAGKRPKAAPTISGTDRIGAAVSAGAFPLLFGGGPGMALGGAIGGAAAGATFGPAAIALQVLGGALDQFVAKTAATGQALNELTFDFDTVMQAAGLAGTATASYITEIEKLAGATEAQELATKALAIRIGDEAVASLRELGESTADLGREFETLMTQLGAAIGGLVEPVARFTANAFQQGNLLKAGRANATKDPELERLLAQEQQALTGRFGDPTGNAQKLQDIQQQIRNRQLEIEQSTERTLELRAKTLQRLDNEKSLQTDSLQVLALKNQLVKGQGTLTEENIKQLKEQILQAEFLEEQQHLINRAIKDEISFRAAALAIETKRVKLEEALAALNKPKDPAKPRKLTAEETGEGIARRLREQIAAYEELDPFARKMAVIEAERESIQERINKVKDEELKKELELTADKLKKLKITKAEAEIENEITNLQLQKEDQINSENEKLSNTIDNYHDQLRLLQAKIDGTEDQVALEIKLEKASSDVERNYIRQIDAKTKAIEQLEKQKQLFASIGSAIETGIVDSLTAAVQETKSLAEVASQTLRQVSSILLQFGVRSALSGLGGNDGVGFFSSLFPRALGGPVSSNRPYMVGERGPELFVPGAQGNIVPNHAMGSSNIVVNVDASGTQAQGDQPNAKALGSAIGAAVQAELIKQKRPGGLLA